MPPVPTSPHPVGRLVAVLDATPNPLSLKAFARAARHWIPPPSARESGLSSPTLLAGNTAEALAAFAKRWPRLFYNAAEPAPLHALMGLLPWEEVWLVQEGQVWAMTKGHLLALVPPSFGGADNQPLPAGLAGFHPDDHHGNAP